MFGRIFQKGHVGYKMSAEWDTGDLRKRFISCRGRLLEKAAFTPAAATQIFPYSKLIYYTQSLTHACAVRTEGRGKKKTKCLTPTSSLPCPSPRLRNHFFRSWSDWIFSSRMAKKIYNRHGCQPRNKSNFCDTHLPISCMCVCACAYSWAGFEAIIIPRSRLERIRYIPTHINYVFNCIIPWQRTLTPNSNLSRAARW